MKYLPVYYLGHLIDVLSEHSFPIEAWLQQHQLSTETVYSVETKIAPEQFDELIQQALSQGNMHHIGLTIGRKLQIAHHGTFGLALLNCETIEQMIKFVQQYLVIRIPFIEINIVHKHDQVLVLAKDTHWQGDLHRFVIEAVSGAMFNIFMALQQKVPTLSIDCLFFDYPKPQYIEKYNMFSPTVLEFDRAYCGVAINEKLLNQKIPNVDKLGFIQAQQACEQELQKWLQFASVSGKVQQCLMQKQFLRASLESVAQQLNISTRTLHRQLKQEGNSFKKIQERHQASIARECLLVYGYSVSQTAANLGFDDVANFRRAFKRWYSCTPSDFLDKNKA